jgi:hypothetical protein
MIEVNTVRVENIRANDALELEYELVDSGLIQDLNFSWMWYSPTIRGTSAVEFNFKNPALATFYALRWT